SPRTGGRSTTSSLSSGSGPASRSGADAPLRGALRRGGRRAGAGLNAQYRLDPREGAMNPRLASLVAAVTLSLASGAAVAQANQPIKTGVDATFAPHAMPKLGGGVEGFNIDLGMEIARRLGRPIEIDGTEFSALIPGMNAKKYDFVLAPTTATPERAKTMLFSEGYME